MTHTSKRIPLIDSILIENGITIRESSGRTHAFTHYGKKPYFLYKDTKGDWCTMICMNPVKVQYVDQLVQILRMLNEDKLAYNFSH
jgi:hypothetical protein